MRKGLLTVLMAIVWVLFAFAGGKSQTIVYINGTKYYIHTVEEGETLYSLAKTYNVAEKTILEHNPAVANGLRVKDNIKIPVVESRKEKLSRKKMRKTFNTHIVARGETLYGISRQYEIPIPTIMEDNADLDPLNLKLGQQILIRKKQIGTESEQDSKADWDNYRDQLNTVAPDTICYHIVEKGETFYALSHKYGITEQQLSELNDNLQPEDLKAGQMIRIAREKAPVINTDSLGQMQDSLKNLRKGAPQITFHKLASDATLHVSLLLPMSSKGVPNENYIDLYQGFLVGLDSVKINHGYSVEVKLFNTGRNEEEIKQILESEDFADTQLIVGPVYESGIYPVIRYAEEHEIPVISPLAQMQTNSDVLFQMTPATESKYDKMADLVGKDKSVTLIYSTHTDQEFEREMLDLLGNRPYKRFNYTYTGAGDSGDLSALVNNKEQNVFVIMTDNEMLIDRIMASLASAYTNLKARGHEIEHFKVLGNARWNRLQNLDRTTWFKNNTSFISTYHAKRDCPEVMKLDKTYLALFGSLPSLYSYRGYDAARIFVPAMFNDMEYDMEAKRYAPLQSAYLFRQGEDRATHINYNWTRVNYNPDFSLTIE